ncbi:MAG TPA: DUF882 domain-containing protein [bacterium]|nr:DUF882 domain-containing protein [bacterium]
MARFRFQFLLTALFSTISITAAEAQAGRFFLMGDGVLTVNGQKVPFRQGDGNYDPAGLKALNQIFKADWAQEEERMDLRFLEAMDYIQDQLRGRGYNLKSGYRSPRLNQSLRNKGKLAAQSSMHMEAAAGDLILLGVNSADVYEFVKGLDCCGIGYYHGRHFHFDTGPARYWDETSSKTEDKTPQENEKIILQPEFDRYRSGETMRMKFMRATNYPFGADAMVEVLKADDSKVAGHTSLTATGKECLIVQDRHQGRTLSAKLPELKPGSYVLRIHFCNRYDYAKMPESILTRPFEIAKDLR